jgi:hypothetical protein
LTAEGDLGGWLKARSATTTTEVRKVKRTVERMRAIEAELVTLAEDLGSSMLALGQLGADRDVVAEFVEESAAELDRLAGRALSVRDATASKGRRRRVPSSPEVDTDGLVGEAV